MGRVKSMLEWCLKKVEKGILKIEPSKPLSAEHIEKANHNLKVMTYLISGEFSDWAVSAAFYAMYHALLAVLFRFGYDSRNQECTISAVEYLIREKKINLDSKYIEMVRRTKEMVPKDAKSLREEFQYGTKVSVNPLVLNNLKHNAVELVETVQILLEELK